MEVGKQDFPVADSNIAVCNRNIAIRNLDLALHERGYCRSKTESSGRRQKRFD
jgi:hypothetical protein